MKRLTRLAQSAASSRRSSTVNSITSNDHQDVEGVGCATDKECFLLSLPPEILIEILFSLADLASLRSAIFTCRALYRSYLVVPERILSLIAVRDIGRCETDADAVAGCSRLHDRGDEKGRLGIFDLIDGYRIALGLMPLRLQDALGDDHFEGDPPGRLERLKTALQHVYSDYHTPPDPDECSPVADGNDAIAQSKLHLAVRTVADSFCTDVLPQIPNGKFGDASHTRSSNEEHRIFRALYRFELYCRIFCHKESRAFSLNSEEKALLFLPNFTRQEANEISSVYLYIHHKYKSMLVELDKGKKLGEC